MMRENIDKLIEYQRLVEKHKYKEFCNWHKADQDDFLSGYYNMQNMIINLIAENEKLKEEKSTEVIRLKAHYRNACDYIEDLKKRIKKLNKFNKFDIIEI